MSVLVTGGTGTFGQAYVRRALLRGGTRICVYSRDEYKQAVMREAMGNDPRLRWFIGDVRDYQRLVRALEGVETVIHAAALKRVEVGEFNPDELVKTNVLGTMNVIEAAHAARVAKVIAISTDKAAAPVNAYGASKLLMEKVILAANNARGARGPRFACIRLGNFAGSRGSVIPMWRTLIAMGARTVPVTDPECTRFVMTETQALNLALELEATMQGGELVIPDLKAFRLGDLIEAMGVTGEVIGLRPGERLHEEFGRGISSDAAPRLTVSQLRDLAASV